MPLLLFLLLLLPPCSQVIACNLSRDEIKGLKKMFKEMDRDGSGSITYAELREGMRRLGNAMPEAQLQAIMEAVSAVLLVVRSSCW